MFLTAPTNHVPPLPDKSFPEQAQIGRIARYSVILTVASDDQLEPFPSLR